MTGGTNWAIVDALVEELSLKVREHKPLDPISFLAGYLISARDYAIWNNGEQFIGAGFTTVKQLAKAIEIIAEEYKPIP